MHRSPVLLWLSLVCLLAALTACAPTAAEPNPTSLPAITPEILPTLPVDAAGIPLVSRVNGEGINQTLFERAFARAQQQLAGAADAAALRDTVLNTLIEQLLITQEAARQQVVVTDAEIDAELSTLAGDAGSEEAWQQWLTSNLYTVNEFREELRSSLLNAKMRDRVTAELNGDVPHVHARHILVATEAEANEILNRLRNGEDFATLALQSLDTTNREQGGDLGWFTQDELIDPALGTIAFSLEPMQIAGPIRTSLGYHVIQSLERGALPLTEERRAQLAQRQFENWLAALVASATIERFI